LPLPMGPLGAVALSLGSVSAEMEPGGGGGGGLPPKSLPSVRLPGEADSALSDVCSTHEPEALPSGLRFMETPSVEESEDGYVKASTCAPLPFLRVTESPLLPSPSAPVEAATALV